LGGTATPATTINVKGEHAARGAEIDKVFIGQPRPNKQKTNRLLHSWGGRNA